MRETCATPYIQLRGSSRASFIRHLGADLLPIVSDQPTLIDGKEYGPLHVYTIDPLRLDATTQLKLAAWIARDTGETLGAMLADVSLGKSQMQMDPSDQVVWRDAAWG